MNPSCLTFRKTEAIIILVETIPNEYHLIEVIYREQEGFYLKETYNKDGFYFEKESEIKDEIQIEIYKHLFMRKGLIDKNSRVIQD